MKLKDNVKFTFVIISIMIICFIGIEGMRLRSNQINSQQKTTDMSRTHISQKTLVK